MNLFDYAAAGQPAAMECAQDGLRLRKLEVYNWGTFDQKIWSFAPNGETTLLTGDSGSGKSTLVDALITLLVSPRKTQYNKAADASAKERSVTSYVRGYYGRKYAYEGKGKPEALRDGNQYSVLLAMMADAASGKVVTLAMFFWFKEQQIIPERFYVVAQQELFIAQDFSGFSGNVKQLRAALSEKGCEVFQDYNHYAACFQKELGGLTPQAIDLFQQTISMKKVDALTEFVRDNMLEETDIAQEIQKLLKHYFSLDSAYEAVQRAQRQVQRLQPICTNGTQYVLRKAALAAVTQGQAALEYWYAKQKETLYVQKVSELDVQRLEAEQQLKCAQLKLKKLEQDIKQLEQEIYKNGGAALENLKLEFQRKAETQRQRFANATRYEQNAFRLEMELPRAHAGFVQNQNKADILRHQLPEQARLAQNQLTEISVQLEKGRAGQKETEQELVSLRGRTSNIPATLIALRSQLCTALSISQDQLPFAGELLEVKESENEWEGAIERLLHSFALSLLVPEAHYARVGHWVDEHHLGQRLVYFAVRSQQRELPQLHPYAVATKLEVKQQTVFTKWLTCELAHHFSHVCCNEFALFQQEKRAITKAGQIKSAARHEKDDRRKLLDPTQYVLGFSNQKKIEALVAQEMRVTAALEQIETEKQKAEEWVTAIADQKSALEGLYSFADFSEIDTQSVADEMQDLRKKIEEIETAKDSVLSILSKQKNEAEAEKEKQETLVSNCNGHFYTLINALENKQREQAENNKKIETETAAEKAAYPYLEQNKTRFLGDVVLGLQNSDAQERRYARALQDEQGRIQKKLDALMPEIEKGMALFRRDFPNEVRDTDDTVESLPEYHSMLEQLNRDDLPRYEADFKDRLTSQMINQIALFHTTLKQQHEFVKRRIDDINKSLYEIDYNPHRFIRLNCEESADSEIKAFRTQLKACTEDSTHGFEDEALAKARFLQIKEIIERFQGREKETEADKKWTKKVTDVRNWFVFSASERWRQDGEEYEHYADSDGKSGGQKEKLAYTILAASLVYNYGLQQDYIDRPSFRLVVIDEAFLKSSDDSAKYGLQLFQKLQFQMVIVTPLLKISTIEPFIAHVGFVSHNDLTHRSTLSNISIEVYQQKRKAWEAQHFVELDGQQSNQSEAFAAME